MGRDSHLHSSGCAYERWGGPCDCNLKEVKSPWEKRVIDAATKLIKCKGRYHAELNYKELEEIIKERK